MADGRRKKLLLIGWDAADWRVIDPLIAQGKMPYLQALIQRGMRGNLATLHPVLSPMLWTSIATGKRPYKHGVHGFSEPDPVSGGIRPVTNLSRKTKAVWNILHQNGFRPGVVGWWPSHPAEPLERGFMVSNHYQRIGGKTIDDWRLDPACIYPERLYEILKELRFHPTEIEQEDAFTFLPFLREMDQKALDRLQPDPHLRSLYSIISNTTTIHSAATALMQNEEWDFLAVYHDAIDHYGHAFMKYHPPRDAGIAKEDFDIWKDVIESGYRFADLQLGTMIELAGEDTTIVLMSDHGFHPDHRRPRELPNEPAGPAAEHRQFGILVAAGPEIKQQDRIYGASVIDICPTILHHFGLPPGDDMDGRVLRDLWTDHTWLEEGDPPRNEIASWDEVPGNAGTHPLDKQMAPADSKAALEALVALGYIEQPNEDRAIAIEETVREFDYNLACSYIDGGIFSEAVVLLERLYERWPSEHRFGIRLANAYQALKRVEDVRQTVDKLSERRLAEAEEAKRELAKRRLDDEVVRASERERLRSAPEAERKKYSDELRELMGKAHPNLFSLHYYLALADFSEERYEEALEKLECLDDDYGLRSNALCLRGDVYLCQKRWADAREAFAEANDLDEESPGPHLGMGRASLGEGDFETAVAHIRQSLRLLHYQPAAHHLLGRAYFRRRRFDEAEEALRESEKQAPLLADNYRLLGEIAEIRRDFSGLDHYKRKLSEALGRAIDLKERKVATQSDFPVPGSPADSRVTPLPELKLHQEKTEKFSESDTITIVSGLPRSGTSLMMQILKMIGVEPYTDDVRGSDRFNPKGYFEHDRVTRMLSDPYDHAWLLDTRGKAIKIVAPLLSATPLKISSSDGTNHALSLRLIMMDRPMAQVIESQRRMLESQEAQQCGPVDLVGPYRQQLVTARKWAQRWEIPSLEICYTKLVEAPESFSAPIAKFLRRPVRPELLRRCVRPELYHVRQGD